jgi:CheY-like chemotaxis protein
VTGPTEALPVIVEAGQPAANVDEARETRQGTYVLHFAASGEETVQLLNEGIEPQLIAVLSDINMPGMDGFELLREIKAHHPKLPVMMVTAYGDDDRRRRTDELGATEFLTSRSISIG